MSGMTPDSVIRRLDQLERQNRRLRLVGGLALLGLAILLLTGQTLASNRVLEADTVEAKVFILKDSRGQVRALLSTQPNDLSNLTLVDADGKIRTILMQGVLTLHDAASKIRIGLTLGNDDVPRLEVLDSSQTTRVRVGMDVPAPVQIGTLGLSADPRGTTVPAIRLYDEHGDRGRRRGNLRAEMLVREDGAPFVQLRDEEQKVSAQLALAKDGTPGLGLWGRRSGIGAPSAEIALSFSQNGLPSLRFTNKDSRVIWKAP